MTSPESSTSTNAKTITEHELEQFRYGFANAVSEEEARQLYEEFAVRRRASRCSRRPRPT